MSRTQSPRPPQLTPKARRPSSRDHTAATGSWLVSMSIILLTISSVLLLRPLFVTIDWVPEIIVMAAAVCLTSAFARIVTGSHGVAGCAGFVAALVVLGVVLRPDGPGGLLTAAAEAVAEIGQQLTSDVPPLRPTRAFSVLLAAVTAITALFAELCVFAFRARVAGLLPFSVFPLLPVALGIEEVATWPYLGLIASIGLYLFAVVKWNTRITDEELAVRGSLVDERGAGGWRGAITVAAAAGALALAATSVFPAPAGVPGLNNLGVASLATNRANPIIDLGSDLRRPDPMPVMRYLTTARSGPLPYFTLVSLTDLGGNREWQPAEFTGDIELAGQLPEPAGLAPDAQRAQVVSNIVLEPGVSAYLPQPGYAQQVADVEGRYLLDESTGNIRSAEEDAPAQRYQMNSVVPVIDEARVAATPLEVPQELQALTEVPQGEAAERIRGVLDGIIDPAASPYAQALQVQQHFRSGYEYSLDTPLQEGYDGTNLSVVATFLDVRSGYCVHYSSAMAVMGRMLGIPTRIQVGFTPGSPQGTNEAGQLMYGITSAEMHAWAELYVPGMGWVPFETTPSDGLGNLVAQDVSAPVPPDAAPQPQPSQQAPQETQPPAGETQAPQEASPAPGASGEQPGQPDQESEASQADDDAAGGEGLLRFLGIAAGIVLLVLLLALPMLARMLVRRRRAGIVAAGAAGAADDGPPAAALAWRELLDEAWDLRKHVPVAAPPREQEAFLLGLMEPRDDGKSAAAGSGGELAAREAAREGIERLRIALERALFADPARPAAAEELPRWEDVERAERVMRAQLPGRTRLLALLLPASLLARRSAAGTRSPRAEQADQAEPRSFPEVPRDPQPRVPQPAGGARHDG